MEEENQTLFNQDSHHQQSFKDQSVASPQSLPILLNEDAIPPISLIQETLKTSCQELSQLFTEDSLPINSHANESFSENVYLSCQRTIYQTLSPFPTIIHVLKHWSEKIPNQIALQWYEKGKKKFSATYQELWTSIELVSKELLKIRMKKGSVGVTKGELVMLLFEPGLEFYVCFYACLRIGVIAVPAYPPNPANPEKGIQVISNILNSSHCRFVVMSKSIQFLKFTKGKWPTKLTTTGEILTYHSISVPFHSSGYSFRSDTVSTFPNSPDIAFLQYTSGSTGHPKGVVIKHSNFLYNVAFSGLYVSKKGCICTSWLPQYHDMGLALSTGSVLFAGGSIHLMSPLDFLADPLVWFDVMSESKSTVSIAPNFAFGLVTRKWNSTRARKWDLSSLACLGNSSEPILLSTVNAFKEKLLQDVPSFPIENGIIPGYGMAECVVFVGCTLVNLAYPSVILCEHPSSKSSLEKNDDGKTHQPSPLVVSLPFCNLFGGVAIISRQTSDIDEEEAVYDGNRETRNTKSPRRVIVPQGIEGEIWLCNPSVAAGYWKNEELTKEIFLNTLPYYDPDKASHLSLVNGEETKDLKWLSTGDLGFILNGHMFISGRCKDLIIVRGKNYYPQDIESIVQEIDAKQGEESIIRPGCVISFGLSSDQIEISENRGAKNLADTEGLVVICEIRNSALQRYGKRSAFSFLYENRIQEKSIEEITLKLFYEVNKELGSLLIQLVFIKERTIPKTTSGKLRRSYAKELWLKSKLETVFTIPVSSQHMNYYVKSPADSLVVRRKDNPDGEMQNGHQKMAKEASKGKVVDITAVVPSFPGGADDISWVTAFVDELLLTTKNLEPNNAAFHSNVSDESSIYLRKTIREIIQEFSIVDGDTSLVSLGLDSVRCFELLSVVTSRAKSQRVIQFLSSIPAYSLFNCTGKDLISLLFGVIPANLTNEELVFPLDSWKESDRVNEMINEKDKIASSPKRFVLMHHLFSLKVSMKNEYSATSEDSLNEFISLQIDGLFNIDAFQRTLELLKDRHESLRSYFLLLAGDFSHLVESSCKVSLEFINCSQTNDNENIKSLVFQFVETPFDLSAAPLWRCQLISTAEHSYVLTLVFHHSIVDGSSILLLLKELFLIYHHCCLDNNHSEHHDFVRYLEESPPLSKQLEIERRYLSSLKRKDDELYWEAKLQNYERISFPSFSIANDSTNEYKFFEIPTDIHQLIKTYCKRKEITPYICYLTGFYCLLARYFDQRQDFIVATAFLNRFLSPETRHAIGCFVNTLPLRFVVNLAFSFGDLVVDVRKSVESDILHGQLPYEQIVKESSRRTELLDLFFVYQEGVNSRTESNGLQVKRFLKEHSNLRHQPNFLFFELREVDEVIEVLVNYKTSFLTGDMASRMFSHYLNILEQGICNEKLPFFELPMLAKEELLQQCFVWNGQEQAETATTITCINDIDPCLSTIHELFERQVTRTAERIAISFEEKNMTYRELNERSNQVAHFLRSKCGIGSKPDMLVGIGVERSLEMSIGILGILKAGGAYVPLDPNYPDERLKFIIEDTSLKLIFIESISKMEKWMRIFPDGEVSLVPLMENQEISTSSIENPTHTSNARDLCYVIYTSGSTGRPKGAMLEHAGVINCLLYNNKTYMVTDADVFLQKTAFTFDASVLELLCPLLTGARLIFAIPEGHKDVHYLVKMLYEKKITILLIVPSLLNFIIEVLSSRKDLCDSLPLRIISAGGEILTRTLSQKTMKLLKNVTVYNQYGPTEASIDSSIFECSLHYQTGPDRESIGKSFPNVSHFILNSSRRLLPIGVVGELYIGGIALARGYLNRPELTADRFIDHYFPELNQTMRLYRTGDLVRYREDGNIDCLGRMDYQVKIRGFRVELGEIETELMKFPKVKEAAVVVSDRLGKENIQLVGFLILEKESKENKVSVVDEIKSFLRISLLEHMIPAHLIVLESMPYLTSGKLDRNALVALCSSVDIARSSSSHSRILVAGVELSIAVVWSEVLGIPFSSLRAEDDFFNLGGNSLLVLKCLSLFQSKLHKTLTFAEFYQFPTIENIGKLFERNENMEVPAKDGVSFVIKLSRKSLDDYSLPKLFLIHPVLGLATFYQGCFFRKGIRRVWHQLSILHGR